ncbi:neuroendocrine convertase 1-like protein [Dinothrombium tinctorium]|uniref:Neuroendocrine convertase 1-like protein n=1 Tax=Dinothrombium tinctorium TaxID=1965070 RepID=A0A3S3P774_9ACAR|nr:neuroendocrine convertase 1-like protein [Dinothrombium tinctorium]
MARQIPEFERHYTFVKLSSGSRNESEISDYSDRLKKDVKVKKVEYQTQVVREKRVNGYTKRSRANKISFNDELWKHQWYLGGNDSLGSPYHALKVNEVWRLGYTGNGIVVTVIADGMLIHFMISFKIEKYGTSSAASLASGIIALVLEAKDIQHLVAITSDPKPLDPTGWRVNGAGLIYNNKFGFGLMNAEAMVKKALNWTNVPPKSSCTVELLFERLPLTIFSLKPNFINFLTNGCKNTTNEVNIIEHVQVTLSISYPIRGYLEMLLISPSNSISKLLSQRKFDKSPRGFKNWEFSSVHFWGERPHGLWTLVIKAKVLLVCSLSLKDTQYFSYFGLKERNISQRNVDESLFNDSRN